jgi:5-methylcytosine-specific restriction protein A
LSNEIPALSRTLVKEREQRRCARCSVASNRGHWHHRRSRSVRDDHRHCPCNGVWLCATCHQWVHANPLMARIDGFIVSRHVAEPFTVPVATPLGWRWQDCEGHIEYEESN